MEPSAQVPLKDIRVKGNVIKKPSCSCSWKEDTQLDGSYCCMLCQRLFSSQVSLGAHFTSCIMSSTSKSADTFPETNNLGQLAPIKFHNCKMCSVKLDGKCTWEGHQAKCEYQHKEGKKEQNSLTSTLSKPDLPILYYCNICSVGFDEKHSWESHLAKCEYHPKHGKKDQNGLTSSFTKEPTKDILHEKVIEDEAWLVTSLPQGYECVDAMFVVEAEGTCMLQQEIPVDSEEEEQQLEFEEEQKDQKKVPGEEGISSLEQDFLPPWSLSLLPGALEAEEEKEMMEQKLVLEPRFMQSAFVCLRGQPPEDVKEQEEEELQDPLALTEIPEVTKEPKEVVDKAEKERAGENVEEESKLNSEVVPDSLSTCLEQLRVVDTQVACH